MKTFAIANQKGGVGKTASAVTLASGAAKRGLRVLLIDLDPQGNVADSLGMTPEDKLGQWLGTGNIVTSKAETAMKNLDVIKSNKTTSQFIATLPGMMFKERILANRLEEDHAESFYDLCIFDCAPSVDILHVAALVACDYLLVPAKLDQFSMKGITEITKTMASINQVMTDKKRALAGIIPTFYELTTHETQSQLELLVGYFGQYVWPVVPLDTQIREANRLGETLWDYNPKSRALVGLAGVGGGYQACLDRLMDLL